MVGKFSKKAKEAIGGEDQAKIDLVGKLFKDLRSVALQLPATDAAILATAKQMFEWRRRHRFCVAS